MYRVESDKENVVLLIGDSEIKFNKKNTINIIENFEDGTTLAIDLISYNLREQGIFKDRFEDNKILEILEKVIEIAKSPECLIYEGKI